MNSSTAEKNRSFSTIELEKVQFICNQAVDRSQLVHSKVTVSQADSLLRHITISLQAEIWGRCVHKETHAGETIEIPVSWLQHLRKALGLKYQQRTVPTRTVYRIYHLCPHVAFDDLDKHIAFMAPPKGKIGTLAQ